jgi:hypothetical protein
MFRSPAISVKTLWLALTLFDPAKNPEGEGFVIGDTGHEPGIGAEGDGSAVLDEPKD